MTAPPPPPPPRPPARGPPPHQHQPHHAHFPPPFPYAAAPPPPLPHASAPPNNQQHQQHQQHSLPHQTFVPHLTYMEGQFATQALLVEQQRRIKQLEAELASTQLEVLRLRNQVHHAAQQHQKLPPQHQHGLPQPAEQGLLPSHPHPTLLPVPPHPSAVSRPTVAAPPGIPTHPNVRNVPVSSSQQLPIANQPQPPPEETKKASSRYWTADEHARFLEGLQLFGQKDIKAISRHVGTRSATQVRTHAQKYYLRIERERQKAEQEGRANGTPPGPGGASSSEGGASNGKVATGKSAAAPKKGAAAKPASAVATADSNVKPDAAMSPARATANSNPGRADTPGRDGVAAETEGNSGNSRAQTNGRSSVRHTNGNTNRVILEGGKSPVTAHLPNGADSIANLPNARTDTMPVSTAIVAPHANAKVESLPGPTAPPFSSQPIPVTADNATILVPGQALPPATSQVPSAIAPKPESVPQQGIPAVSPDKSQVPKAVGLNPLAKPELELPSLKGHTLPPPAPGTDLQSSMPMNAVHLSALHTDKEATGDSRSTKELGKRQAQTLTKKSPKKRLKKPVALVPHPAAPSSSVAISSANMNLANLPKAGGPSGANGPSGRLGESKLYGLGEHGGSMSNLRALLRVPGDEAPPGPSGSKPPTLRRNESSNSVLADLSKNVGVLSRSNSFISPNGKGVTRSNSILSLLSGIPTALRESPSSERLLMLDGGEDRVMATLKSMDTGGSSGPTQSGAGPSTAGQNPLGAMGDRSFSFGQLQHMGLDDLEDPSAVALALQEEQKWGDG